MHLRVLNLSNNLTNYNCFISSCLKCLKCYICFLYHFSDYYYLYYLFTAYKPNIPEEPGMYEHLNLHLSQ